MRKFFKSFYITLVIISLLFFIVYSSAKVFESTYSTKYGEYKKAVQIEENGIYFFDFKKP